jgi:phosphatidate cytidylyltransferase
MTRLVSGLVLAAVALAAILFLPPGILRYVVIGIALLTASEYLAIARKTQTTPTPWVVFGLVAVACWWISLSRDAQGATYPVLVLALGLLIIDVLFIGKSLPDSAVALIAPLYIGMPLGMLVAIHALGGREAVLLLIATIVVSDSSQYYTGRMFGRHALAPTVSPKKTIEGALGGVAIGTAFLVVAGRFVFPMARPAILLAMGISIVLLGITGDLFESKLKRVAGVKDSSTLIPGHGGVLDRIDALLLATPAFYLFLHELM